MHLAVTPIALFKIGTVLASIFHNVVTQQQVQTSFPEYRIYSPIGRTISFVLKKFNLELTCT